MATEDIAREMVREMAPEEFDDYREVESASASPASPQADDTPPMADTEDATVSQQIAREVANEQAPEWFDKSPNPYSLTNAAALNAVAEADAGLPLLDDSDEQVLGRFGQELENEAYKRGEEIFPGAFDGDDVVEHIYQNLANRQKHGA